MEVKKKSSANKRHMPLHVIYPARGNNICLIYLTISIKVIVIQAYKTIFNADMVQMPLKEAWQVNCNFRLLNLNK